MKKRLTFLLFCSVLFLPSFSQQNKKFAVIAYYAGKNVNEVDSFSVEKITHLIYSFAHLKGNRLNIDKAIDTMMIQKMVGLKQKNPDLKVLLSLGGWGGCQTCSDVFSTKNGRKEFVQSVKNLSHYFNSDGIDLDWEYPTIEGFPDHKFQLQDKKNFTALIKQLRKQLGKHAIISFAAGGFDKYLNEAIDWRHVMKKVNYVNLMTYDLVNGYSKTTGHHTPLLSTDQQKESVDNAVQNLLNKNVPSSKIVIGAAFYGRMWQSVADANSGLYQQGSFVKSISYKNFSTQLFTDSGFVYHWDEKAMAPYLYNPSKKLFITYDDRRSVEMKTKYAIEKKLGGIMFWQLTEDLFTNGLLDAIDKAKASNAN